MRKVFLSFLGRGTFKQDKKVYEYDPVIYELDGRMSRLTRFVQVAEMELLGADTFDRIIIVATEKSYRENYTDLKNQLDENSRGRLMSILISEDMSAKGQWEWFERILAQIDHGDDITVDLTHGYRSIPIVFSAAINFLQKARDIRLSAVYYGVYEKKEELGYAPIVDMKDFYVINEWADAVSRLVEDADARKMAQLGERTPLFQMGELNNLTLVMALEDLTNTIRNVDVNNIPYKAGNALGLIEARETSASVTGRILLRLMVDKFTKLAAGAPWNGRYTETYFNLQLEVISLLLHHKLFMQAYTAMREFVGSIGMLELEKEQMNPSDRRGKRSIFAEVFVKMLQFPEDEWMFEESSEKVKNKLTSYYHKLKEIGLESMLRSFTKDLAAYRNGFDHAWTRKSGALPDIEAKGKQFLNQLREAIVILKENGLLDKGSG